MQLYLKPLKRKASYSRWSLLNLAKTQLADLFYFIFDNTPYFGI